MANNKFEIEIMQPVSLTAQALKVFLIMKHLKITPKFARLLIFFIQIRDCQSYPDMVITVDLIYETFIVIHWGSNTFKEKTSKFE